jgi:glycosyltransferase involved in cell wall biosynthesis
VRESGLSAALATGAGSHEEHSLAGCRLAVVGMSEGQVCGMHDHSVLLGRALADLGIRCSEHWLVRSGDSLRATRAEIAAWRTRLVGELAGERPDAVLWHYSIFTSSYRGLPLFVAPVIASLRRSRVPVIAVMHEAAYPWGIGGWRGPIWALTHRLVLVDAVRLCRGIVVTTGDRASWLRTRWWLARRPLRVAPVFSNLPAPAVGPPPVASPRRVGLFGYSYDENAVSVVLDALRLLRVEGLDIELILLGSPGRASPSGEGWLADARARGLADAVSFTEILPAQALSDAIASCEVLLSANPPGPSSRKGSLAASLASGRPLVALDGPDAWREPVESGAVEMVPAHAPALAAALRALLADSSRRRELGVRGRSFAEERMGVGVTANAVIALLDGVLAPAHREPPG